MQDYISVCSGYNLYTLVNTQTDISTPVILLAKVYWTQLDSRMSAVAWPLNKLQSRIQSRYALQSSNEM